MTIHIYAPSATAKYIKAQTCPDCKKRTRLLCFFTPWYGDNATCIRCGREWADSEWMPLNFTRGVRAHNIACAKKKWRAMPPISANHYGIE